MSREPETEVEWKFLNGCDESDLVEEVKLYKREFNRLEALIQQTHGCHHSWINRAVESGKEVERLRAENAELRKSVATMSCNHKGIGLPDCRICDPNAKPGADE